MEWTQVRIFTTTAGIDRVAGILEGLNIGGFSIEDSRDFEEFLNDTSPNWDYVDDSLMALRDCESSVTAYLPRSPQGADMLYSLEQDIKALRESDAGRELGRLEIEQSIIREEDWANNWKQYFKPFTVGRRLLVLPSWEKCEATGERKVLTIDPGSSFGTGQHHTTRLCLEELERTVKEGDSVADIGCGSGILSIAALLLGARGVCAVDIDSNAVRIAGENLSLNGFNDEKVALFSGNILTDKALFEKIASRRYDVVVANIVADVLIAMADLFPALVKDGGVLICSGIIEPRRGEVKESIEQKGFAVLSSDSSGGWCEMAFSKKI